MVRSASPDREHQSIFFSAEADAPAAIQSWIRRGGSWISIYYSYHGLLPRLFEVRSAAADLI